jgi:hypothetical protein
MDYLYYFSKEKKSSLKMNYLSIGTELAASIGTEGHGSIGTEV